MDGTCKNYFILASILEMSLVPSIQVVWKVYSFPCGNSYGLLLHKSFLGADNMNFQN